MWRAIFVLFLLSVQSGFAQNASPFASFDLASEPVLNDPHDLEIGPDGRLYVADKFGNRIVVMDPETLEIVEVIDEGRLPGIHDISIAEDGTTIVAVTGLSAVAIYDLGDDGMKLRSVFSGFSRTEGALVHTNGRFYVVASGTGVLAAIEGEEVVATASGHPGAHDVEEAPDGSIWLADNFNRRLVRYSQDLEVMQVLDDPKFGFVGPRYLDVDDFGRLIVADQDAHRVLMIDPLDESLLGVIGDGTPGMGPGKFDDPEGVEIDGNRYFFADSDNNRIVRYVVVMN